MGGYSLVLQSLLPARNRALANESQSSVNEWASRANESNDQRDDRQTLLLRNAAAH